MNVIHTREQAVDLTPPHQGQLDLSLATSSRLEDRALVAKSEDSPPEVLSRLAVDRSQVVRKAARRNAATPRLFTATFDERIELTVYGEIAAANDPRRDGSTRHERWAMWIRQGREYRELWQVSQPWWATGKVPTPVSEDWSIWIGTVIDELLLEDAQVIAALSAAADQGRPISQLAVRAWRLLGDAPTSGRRRVAARVAAARPGDIDWLGRDRDVGVRRALAGNQHVDGSTLEGLSRDRNPVVRAAAADHLPAGRSLLRLTDDADPQVRRSAATNPHLPLEVLMRLTEDSEAAVREAALHNHSLPDAEARARIAEFLRRKADWTDRCQRLPGRIVFCDLLIPGLRLRITEHDGGAQTTTARTERWDVVAHVAGTELDIGAVLSLEVLREQPSPVGSWLAWMTDIVRNDNLEDEQVLRLLGAPNSSAPALVARSMAEWRALAASPHRELLAGAHLTLDIPEFVLERYATALRHDIREFVAAHNNTPAPTLDSLAGDPYHRVRRAAAGNPNTPPAVRSRLAYDADEFVRHAASQSPRLIDVSPPPKPDDQASGHSAAEDFDFAAYVGSSLEDFDFGTYS
jgi:hypothetical protein